MVGRIATGEIEDTTDKPSNEAQARLAALDHSEDAMFRFRLGNLPRVWGFRRVAEFHVVWFDPNHEIYPTDPK